MLAVIHRLVGKVALNVFITVNLHMVPHSVNGLINQQMVCVRVVAVEAMDFQKLKALCFAPVHYIHLKEQMGVME
jgi:hypothetical protein